MKPDLPEAKMDEPCPNCGYPRFVRYSSLNILQCGGCKAQFKWVLKKNQPPMVANNRLIHT